MLCWSGQHTTHTDHDYLKKPLGIILGNAVHAGMPIQESTEQERLPRLTCDPESLIPQGQSLSWCPHCGAYDAEVEGPQPLDSTARSTWTLSKIMALMIISPSPETCDSRLLRRKDLCPRD